MKKETILKSLAELRKGEKRKFDQTAELIINLRNFDIKRESINTSIKLPFPYKKEKVAAFLEKESSLVNTITKSDFIRYKNKKDIKKLVDDYDFFIATASLMPAIATTFGRFLGRVGKMPSPQMGVIAHDDENSIKQALNKVIGIVKIRTKEPSLKISLGKESMKDDEIAENVLFVYNLVLGLLTRNKDNIRSVLIKFTMSPPQKLALD